MPAVYTLSTDEFEEALTTAKNVYIQYLNKKGLLTYEQAEILSLTTAILVRKPTFFSKLWDNFARTDQYLYVVVEQKTIEKDSETEPPKKKADLHVLNNEKTPEKSKEETEDDK